jgi:hypothetical protein
MRIISLLICVSFLLLNKICQGQEADSTQNKYVKSFHDYFFIGPVIKNRELSFNMSSLRDSKANLSFKPNNSYSVGLNVNVFDLNLEASVSVPVDLKSISRYGKSDVTDIQLGALTRKFIFETYWQKYSGFYYSYPSLSILPTQAFPQRADIDTRNFGGSFAYVFNNTNFSLRSSYTFNDRQLKSKGSFILGFAFSSFDIRADSALISSNLRSANLESEIDAARFSSIGLAPGYSYNLVYGKFFLNVTLSLGPAHYWVQYHIKELSTLHDIEISTYSSVRVAVGYNGDRFFSGIGYSQQGRNVTFDEIKFSNSISTFRFVAGFRFKEFGLLKKRAFDYARPILKGG